MNLTKVYTKTQNQFSKTSLFVPSQFASGGWSVADDETGGDITITISALPSNGGSAITGLEYQIDGGTWTSLGGTTTGDYAVSGLTDNVEVDVAIRAVNAIGNGTASATKAVTPTTFVAPAPTFVAAGTAQGGASSLPGLGMPARKQ